MTEIIRVGEEGGTSGWGTKDGRKGMEKGGGGGGRGDVTEG